MGTVIDCDAIGGPRELCQYVYNGILSTQDKSDSLQTQIYILAGVGGGVALFLIIIFIAVTVHLSSLHGRANALNRNNHIITKTSPMPNSSKVGGSGAYHNQDRNGQSPFQPAPHSYAQPQTNKGVSSEEELAHLGFSSYTGGHNFEPRATSPLAMSNAGGVRVLPRNPPTAFRQNSGYM